jgi:cyclic pyranopterin phosphate synthase
MLTHVDKANRPTMVDVGDKTVTTRTATAQAVVTFPAELAAELEAGGELRTKKGPVFDTAVVAGVMAVKRTHELIPFCHPLPIDHCQIQLRWGQDRTLVIECTVRTHYKTGVEMEAMTGASVAALTVYDMCKALSHDIVVSDIRLLEKTGGKRDVGQPQA